ncbi:family 43 glycosylhydrolase [Longitalea arenae]|uniref:family 43 glycosylhydrolase n=1 Tax=Longitalea arenae TaxID=2812558 RepID=UPI001966E935|nr:family 43 glycosylhydrolase [Longitalea arenae]
MRKSVLLACLHALLINSVGLKGQNPLIRHQFSADPSARVFGDKVYVYASHDILATEGRGRMGWFCMEDYHVFSSSNLTDWTDHGMIIHQNNVPWVKPDSYSMWAPDCIFRNGKYYFYFPSTPKDTSYARGFTVGVAIADKPEGPFIPQPAPILNVRGIDPNVFIDKDGQAYLYWSQGNIYGAKLKENMVELASEPVVLGNLPDKGLKEGPYLFERNGTYYLTYPHVENKTERLEYAIGDNPLGPFKVTGVIMDESPAGCWTNHHSIIQFKDQWYLFYHHNDYSPAFDKARSIMADSLFFNTDGTIKKVLPSYRGIGVTNANTQIQLDRYSRISDKGASIAFLDTANKFQGWKMVLESAGAWVQYNSVDYGKKKLKSVTVRTLSPAGGHLQIRVQGIDGPVLADIPISASNEWQLVKVSLLRFKPGMQNLFVILKDNHQTAIDWMRFE